MRAPLRAKRAARALRRNGSTHAIQSNPPLALLRRYALTPHSLYAAVSVGLETATVLTVLNRLSKARLNQA